MIDDFFEIYDETYPLVVRLIVSKINNISNVSDLVQNVFMNFYKAYKKDNYIKNYKYFIMDLTKKELYNYYHKMEKEKANVLDIDFSTIENIVKSSEIIEIDFIKKTQREAVWKFVKTLDLTTQKILVLHYLEELSIKDISILLQVNENTVKTKLYRSISLLKERMCIDEGNT